MPLCSKGRNSRHPPYILQFPGQPCRVLSIFHVLYFPIFPVHRAFIILFQDSVVVGAPLSQPKIL